MNRHLTEKQKKRKKTIFHALGIVIFFIALAVFAVIGILIPLRPSESVIENRTLEKFPSFTMASFLNGDYFEEVSTWYSDTYPFREGLLTANASFENLYGIKGEQIIVANAQSEEDTAEDSTMEVAMTEAEAVVDEVPVDEEKLNTESIEGTTEEEEEDASYEIEIDENYVDAAIDVEPEQVGTVYVTGDTGFELFYHNQTAEDGYITMLNKAGAQLSDIANVYAILAPTSVGIDLTEKAQQKVGSTDEKEIIDYIYAGVDDSVKTIETFDLIKSHNSEYLYFRTDHHWTALGAYYAYTAFCAAKGITPTPIDEFETMEFPGFLGTLYSGSNQSTAMRNNPDTVVAYIPKGTNDLTYWTQDLTEMHWNVVFDVSGYREAEKYAAFAAGDQVFAMVTNPEINDGSSVVIVKDSYGNALVPFLVDDYQYVYIVDYRYFSKCPDYNNSVYNLVADRGIDDVLILNNMQILTESQVDLMNALFD